jgi:hypothetical protein
VATGATLLAGVFLIEEIEFTTREGVATLSRRACASNHDSDRRLSHAVPGRTTFERIA